MYKALLFDGQTSAPTEVTVLLYPHRLVIHPDNGSTSDTQSWNISDIKTLRKEADLCQISYGPYPSMVLEVRSPEFSQKFRPPQSSSEKLVYKLTHSGLGVVLLIGTFIIAAVLLLYFFVLPAAAEKSVVFVPKEYEIKMGEAIYKNMMMAEKVDSGRTKSANLFLKYLSFDTDYPLTVTVVTSEIKNAYALPGGHIVVHSHLLDDMKGYEELVALLGHEAGHVIHRHTTKHILRSMSGSVMVSVLFGDLSGIMAFVIDNANQLNQLSYSRNLETEADEAGYETMKRNRINPQGIISLFENLQKGNESSSVVPEFLSTHPVTENRMKNIAEKIKKESPGYARNNTLENLFRKLKENRIKGTTEDY